MIGDLLYCYVFVILFLLLIHFQSSNNWGKNPNHRMYNCILMYMSRVHNHSLELELEHPLSSRYTILPSPRPRRNPQDAFCVVESSGSGDWIEELHMIEYIDIVRLHTITITIGFEAVLKRKRIT